MASILFFFTFSLLLLGKSGKIDKKRIWDGAEEPPYLGQTSVWCQHYGNIIVPLQPKELGHLTSCIYIQGSPFGVTWSDCISTEQLFCFLVIRLLLWNGIHFAYSLILMHRTRLSQINVCFFPPQPGFLHDLMNGTIELIWLSSLYKIRDKIQCLNTPTQSLVQHHHQLKPDLNIEGCPFSGIAPILLYLPAVVDAIVLNKQAFAYDSV